LPQDPRLCLDFTLPNLGNEIHEFRIWKTRKLQQESAGMTPMSEQPWFSLECTEIERSPKTPHGAVNVKLSCSVEQLLVWRDVLLSLLQEPAATIERALWVKGNHHFYIKKIESGDSKALCARPEKDVFVARLVLAPNVITEIAQNLDRYAHGLLKEPIGACSLRSLVRLSGFSNLEIIWAKSL